MTFLFGVLLLTPSAESLENISWGRPEKHRLKSAPNVMDMVVPRSVLTHLCFGLKNVRMLLVKPARYAKIHGSGFKVKGLVWCLSLLVRR